MLYSLIVTFTSDGLCPEAEEILERRESHEEAVGEAVEEEEDEVLDQSEGSITLCACVDQSEASIHLVVVEGDTVVDPGTVVVHLEHARAAHGAVVRAVWLHTRALLAVPHRTLQTRVKCV